MPKKEWVRKEQIQSDKGVDPYFEGDHRYFVGLLGAKHDVALITVFALAPTKESLLNFCKDFNIDIDNIKESETNFMAQVFFRIDKEKDAIKHALAILAKKYDFPFNFSKEVLEFMKQTPKQEHDKSQSPSFKK